MAWVCPKCYAHHGTGNGGLGDAWMCSTCGASGHGSSCPATSPSSGAGCTERVGHETDHHAFNADFGVWESWPADARAALADLDGGA